ncbi:hypothetical protein GCM10009533_63330 [Saccharopolyspora spinosporotrichia]|uniref:Uncharacterized protein n=1 Tax=Saccharopolyspora erythraea TaxID=1836 RepID=A0ABN1E226_SACER
MPEFVIRATQSRFPKAATECQGIGWIHPYRVFFSASCPQRSRSGEWPKWTSRLSELAGRETLIWGIRRRKWDIRRESGEGASRAGEPGCDSVRE